MKKKFKWMPAIGFAFMFIALWCSKVEAKADYNMKVGQTISISDTNLTSGGRFTKSWSCIQSNVISILGNSTNCVITALAPGTATVTCYTSFVKTYQIWVPGYDGYVSSGHYETRYIYDNCKKYYVVNVKSAELQKPTQPGDSDQAGQNITANPGDTGTQAGIQIYKLRFHANGGNEGTMAVNRKLGQAIGNVFPKVTRRGYRLTGWYTKKKGGSKVDLNTSCSGDATYYAHWKKIYVHQVKLRSVSGIVGALEIKIKKVTGDVRYNSYQIAYSVRKNMKKAEKLYYKKLNCNVYGLRRKKNYYIKVRAFETDSTGKKVYGKWSKTMRCKTK